MLAKKTVKIYNGNRNIKMNGGIAMKKRIISFLLVMALMLSVAPTIELSAIAIPENTDAKMRRSYMECLIFMRLFIRYLLRERRH